MIDGLLHRLKRIIRYYIPDHPYNVMYFMPYMSMTSPSGCVKFIYFTAVSFRIIAVESVAS